MGRTLVTGGAGYIGSHVVRILVEQKRDVAVVDDLSTGHREALPEGVPLHVADFADPAVLQRELDGGQVEFVVHLAASCEVGESMRDPAGYYANNLQRSLRLLDAARRSGVRGVVFSSTAATYGEPRETPITEDHIQLPTNPYGETKLAFERALGWYRAAYGLGYICLRYFNAAGAHPDGSIGEDHDPESHLVPRLLCAVRDGGEPIPIFGHDYPTSDGTCIRDYIHVVDLAWAHVRGMDAMRDDPGRGEAFNLGNGTGLSVRQIVDTVEEVTGTRPPTRDAPRRAGDPVRLVASSARIRTALGWKPEFPSAREIIATAWNWHRNHPRGYASRR